VLAGCFASINICGGAWCVLFEVAAKAKRKEGAVLRARLILVLER